MINIEIVKIKKQLSRNPIAFSFLYSAFISNRGNLML